MIFENFPLPLPWHKKVTLQDRFRQNVALNAVVTQLAPSDGLLPFQFSKNWEGVLPVTWKIKCCKTNNIEDYLTSNPDDTTIDISDFIVPALEWTSFVLEGIGERDYIIFKNEKNSLDILADLVDGLPPGVYYMEMDFGEGHDVWVSETFRVPTERFTWGLPPDDDCKFCCFKWSHNTDIKPMHYDGDEDTPFYNLLYLDSFIHASEPIYEVAGDNDGLNEFHASFKKLMVKYRVSAMVPDYIKVALFAFHLHENQTFYSERGLREGDIKNYEITSQIQQPDGALSIVEVMFEQISLLVNTNCPEAMAEPEGVGIGFTPPTIAVDFCESSGTVTVLATGGTIPAGLYGELWGRDGTDPFELAYPYISAADLYAGWSGDIGGGTGFDSFEIRYRTFTYYDGASSGPVAATPSC